MVDDSMCSACSSSSCCVIPSHKVKKLEYLALGVYRRNNDSFLTQCRKIIHSLTLIFWIMVLVDIFNGLYIKIDS
jgi:hypothetical protein